MNTTDELAASIESLVRKHILEVHRSAASAVERAFGSQATAPKPTQRPSARRSKIRRDPKQIEALAERLYAAVCATPGETMAVLAERVGATSGELNQPMNNLRRAGRLRSAGIRNQTRYFPAVGRAASSGNS